MRTSSRHWVPMIFTAAIALGGEDTARAGVDSSATLYPPDGWQNVCAGHTIDVKPNLESRIYTGTGSCWVNIAENKSDGNQQNWVRAPVTLEGVYSLKSSTYSERLIFSIPRGGQTYTVPVTTASSCSDDPWATGGQCGSSPANVNLNASFGWSLAPQAGPLSRNVFGAGLIGALLKKQMSAPPLAPVDVDAVRWPALEGAGSIGRVFWRAPDVSGNKWILAYEIEYAVNSTDSAFTNGGRIVGPGAKSTLSPNEVSRFFYTTFKLGGGDYYFRVCAANDAGRQCSAPVKAREPTRAELMALAHHTAASKVVLGGAGGGTPPPAVAAPPERARMVGPMVLPR